MSDVYRRYKFFGVEKTGTSPSGKTGRYEVVALHAMRRSVYVELIDAHAKLKQLDINPALEHINIAMRRMHEVG